MSLVSFIPILGTIVDRLVPDQNEKVKALKQLELLEQSGELQLMLKQVEVNTNEAKHSSIFVAGWRPFIGWVCGLSFAYHFLGQPIIVFIFAATGHTIDLPVFDMSSLLTVLLGMLGLGGMRSFEKYKGIARESLKNEDK